jgi:hypothetical protein
LAEGRLKKKEALNSIEVESCFRAYRLIGKLNTTPAYKKISFLVGTRPASAMHGIIMGAIGALILKTKEFRRFSGFFNRRIDFVAIGFSQPPAGAEPD